MKSTNVTKIAVVGLLSFFSLRAIATSPGAWQQQPIQVTDTDKHDGPFNTEFDMFVKLMMQLFHVPGLSIAVVDGGKTFSKGYGFATLNPPRNATADTQYFTGSTTKAFTAAAAAMLVHDNETHPDIRWDSRINDFIREDFVLAEEYATNRITLEDALSHRTGLPRHDLTYGQQDDTLRSVVQRMRYLPLTKEPRTKWQYCNLMFAVVTDLVETVTGVKLEDFLEKKIWKPLGMASTTWTQPDPARLARAYYWDPDNGKYVTDPYLDLSPISGAGATISTVNDYALWIKAWLAAPLNQNDSSPITPRMYKELWSPRAILPPEMAINPITPPLYGLSWIITDLVGQPLVSHGGSLTGFGTELFILPDSDFGVVTMANTRGTSNAVGATIAAQLLVKKLGKGAANDEKLFAAIERLPKPHLQSSTSWLRDRPSEFRVPIANDGTAFADSVTKLAGLYSHPAYGQVNLTVTKSEDTSDEGLQFLLYPRMWPLKARLVPKTGSVFKVLLLDPHGCGDIPSGKDIVWEDIGESEAVFEFEPYGGVVRSMGIVLDEEMVLAAKEQGPEHWRDAMIWFERL